MAYYWLPIFAFLAAILVLFPLPSFWRSRNIPVLALVSWLFIVDLVQAINSVIWLDNTRNIVSMWCDITTRIMVGASFALPISTLCICKYLEEVSSSRDSSLYSENCKRRMIIEGGMCFGLPLVFIVLHYIVEAHRFDIFETTGCQSAVYVSIPSLLIICIPQLLFYTIAMTYAMLALRHFVYRRLIFNLHLQNSNSGLTSNHYLRLFMMVALNIAWGIALALINLYPNSSGRLQPWTTWKDVHSNWYHVSEWPKSTVSKELHDSTLLTWWAMPMSSFIIFLSFGFGVVVKQEYLRTCLRCTILPEPPSDEESTKPKLKPLILPSFQNTSKTKKLPQISSPVLISTSNRSLRIPTQSIDEGQASRSDTTGRTMIALSEMSSIYSFPAFAHLHDSSIQEFQSLANTIHMSDGSYRLPEKFSTASSLPGSVEPLQHDSPPSPVYHRPFSRPSICRVSREGLTSDSQRIAITIHRQASVDNVV